MLGFVQNFLVGVEKMMWIELRPLGGWGDALRLLLGLQKGWKLAISEITKKNVDLKILGVGIPVPFSPLLQHPDMLSTKCLKEI